MEYIVEYEVLLHRSVRKSLANLPPRVAKTLEFLVQVLRTHGPAGPHAWKNYGKLRGSGNRYHCHLTANHAYVACWSWEQERLIIEVYYAGTHAKAPY